MRDRRPVDATNPESLAAWARGLRPLVAEIRALAEDATMPRGERLHSRTHLRKMVCRRLRDLETRLAAVTPGSEGGGAEAAPAGEGAG